MADEIRLSADGTQKRPGKGAQDLVARGGQPQARMADKPPCNPNPGCGDATHRYRAHMSHACTRLRARTKPTADRGHRDHARPIVATTAGSRLSPAARRSREGQPTPDRLPGRAARSAVWLARSRRNTLAATVRQPSGRAPCKRTSSSTAHGGSRATECASRTPLDQRRQLSAMLNPMREVGVTSSSRVRGAMAASISAAMLSRGITSKTLTRDRAQAA